MPSPPTCVRCNDFSEQIEFMRKVVLSLTTSRATSDFADTDGQMRLTVNPLADSGRFEAPDSTRNGDSRVDGVAADARGRASADTFVGVPERISQIWGIHGDTPPATTLWFGHSGAPAAIGYETPAAQLDEARLRADEEAA